MVVSVMRLFVTETLGSALTWAGIALGVAALQVLNAWFIAAVVGIGFTLFQEIIPRPGLASGLYANTRRLGAIVSGPLIGLGGSRRWDSGPCSRRRRAHR